MKRPLGLLLVVGIVRCGSEAPPAGEAALPPQTFLR